MLVLLLGPNTDTLTAVVKDEVAVLDADPCTVDIVESLRPDFIVSYGYRHLVPAEVIDAVEGKIVNLHISYLPWNRGADPNLWSWLTNTPKGVTVHWLTEGLDAGDVIAQRQVHFGVGHTLRTSYRLLHENMIQLFGEMWGSLRDGPRIGTEQGEGGSYHRLIDKDRHITATPRGWDTPCADVTEYGRRNGLWISRPA